MVLNRVGPRVRGPRPRSRPSENPTVSTPQQNEADRHNVQQSTGPRTDEGKEASRAGTAAYVLDPEIAARPGDLEVYYQRSEYWHTSLKPFTKFDNYLVDQVSMA